MLCVERKYTRSIPNSIVCVYMGTTESIVIGSSTFARVEMCLNVEHLHNTLHRGLRRLLKIRLAHGFCREHCTENT